MKIKTEHGFGFRSFRILDQEHETIFSGYSLDVGLFSIGFHVFSQADTVGFFHTHPGWAFRWVLWGGYVEEILNKPTGRGTVFTSPSKRWFFPGRFGFVAPSLEHRIDSLMFAKKSVSFWLRGPITARIETRYWPDDELGPP